MTREPSVIFVTVYSTCWTEVPPSWTLIQYQPFVVRSDRVGKVVLAVNDGTTTEPLANPREAMVMLHHDENGVLVDKSCDWLPV